MAGHRLEHTSRAQPGTGGDRIGSVGSMRSLRRDETTEEWVILAPERAQRMREEIRTARPTPPPFDQDCPFCPGNEDRTPPEIHRRPLKGP